jgi:hypothetical protein
VHSRALFVWALIGLVAAPAIASAQNYGDGLGIGGVLLPSGSPLLLGKTRLGNDLGIEIELAFASMSNDGMSSTNLGLGAGVLKHWNQGNEVQPFVAGRAGIGHSSSDMGDLGGESSDTSFYIGAGLGAEYFVTKKLSIEGEAGVRLIFGSLGIETGTRLGALLYL